MSSGLDSVEVPRCRKSLVYRHQQAEVPAVPVDHAAAQERARARTRVTGACLLEAMQVTRVLVLDTRSCGAVAQAPGERRLLGQDLRNDPWIRQQAVERRCSRDGRFGNCLCKAEEVHQRSPAQNQMPA